MGKGVLLFCKLSADRARRAADELAKWLASQKHSVLDVSETQGPLQEKRLTGIQLGVVIGGDGTFLTLVQRLVRKDQFPLVGINLGTLGFITEVNPDDGIATVRSALAGKAKEGMRSLFDVKVYRRKKCVETGTIFNDLVLCKDATTPMFETEVKLGNENLSRIRADGYLVATPTGSTGYALSAGGPIVHPGAGALLLIPMFPHTVSTRPVVLPEDAKLTLVPRDLESKVWLTFDGQRSVPIESGDSIEMTRSATSLRLIAAPSQKWAEALKTKLRLH